MKGLFIKICIVAVTLFASFSVFTFHVMGASEIELIPWDKVNQILPKYSEFTVLDIETGKKFQVQRRAGSHHADVQPISNNDTKIMKQIYNGKWSWRRRAILVIKDSKKIPASMHGMPHGAGALKNNFPGHFCIHFYGSTTHRTNSMDLSHKLMILKAAGKLRSHLAGPDPYEVVNAYIAGLKEQDEDILDVISLQALDWRNLLSKIEASRISRMGMLPVEDLSTEIHMSIPISADFFIKNIGMKRFDGNIEVIRYSPFGPWKIDSISFLKQNGLAVKTEEKSLSK